MELGWRPIGSSSIRRIEGKDAISDRPWSDWPLMDNPWVQLRLDSAQMTIRWDGRIATYDFDNWQLSER